MRERWRSMKEQQWGEGYGGKGMEMQVRNNSNNIQMNHSKHADGTTSVKVHHAPGGGSSFSLAWDATDNKGGNNCTSKVGQQAEKPEQKAAGKITGKSENPVSQESVQQTAKTSVKVHNPPGGRSQITFG